MFPSNILLLLLLLLLRYDPLRGPPPASSSAPPPGLSKPPLLPPYSSLEAGTDDERVQALANMIDSMAGKASSTASALIAPPPPTAAAPLPAAPPPLAPHGMPPHRMAVAPPGMPPERRDDRRAPAQPPGTRLFIFVRQFACLSVTYKCFLLVSKLLQSVITSHHSFSFPFLSFFFLSFRFPPIYFTVFSSQLLSLSPFHSFLNSSSEVGLRYFLLVSFHSIVFHCFSLPPFHSHLFHCFPPLNDCPFLSPFHSFFQRPRSRPTIWRSRLS